MRDIRQVLREKELEIVRVRQEIEALRSILPLLADDEDDVTQFASPPQAPLLVVNRE